ncbi:MAG: 2OG-Fe dioxygenase family protein [Frankiaceae bacterium]
MDVLAQPDQAARTQAWGTVLAAEDFVVVPGSELATVAPASEVDRLAAQWETLELDGALFDGGTYRYRRYGRLLADVNPAGNRRFAPLPHQAFRQAAEHIPNYGGRERLFSPISPEALLSPALIAILAADLAVVEAATGAAPRWEVGLHMIRVVALPGVPGNPTPEGRHRDGHDFVGMHLIQRTCCTGGESTVYRTDRPPVRMMLLDRLDSLILADARLTHEVTPLVSDGGTGVRDMLLVDVNAR